MSGKFPFVPVRLSLGDILGSAYTDAVRSARAQVSMDDTSSLKALATRKVDFYPGRLHTTISHLLSKVGLAVTPPLNSSARGASSAGFDAHTRTSAAPLTGLGPFRIGEDGRLYFTAKSEHYHAPLGHSFPGYQLLEHARLLGIPNATHNNTRGHVTRLLEMELVRAAAGLPCGASAEKLIASKRAATPNRVLNLETGSLAAEAALKMILARFYKPQGDSPEPKYKGRIPVLIVMGDDEGGLQANYHGTTMITQLMRGMWGDLRSALEKQGALIVRSVRPNNLEELKSVFAQYEKNPYKIAGFFHELILMNYAGKRLTPAFVKQAYALCKKHDVPTVVDEIQSCIWSPSLFLFREYGIKPTFVAVGKGFPGGEYPASRILFNASMDNLPQFGALVTNGQEEIASLSYLVTMRWAEANAAITSAVGEEYEATLRDLGDRYSHLVCAIEGRRHLAGIYFHDLPPAKAFADALNKAGFDISVQTYKAGCPPSALTKLPLITTKEMVQFFTGNMEAALKGM
ncbi:MAG: aminotransferase class III-fold pyridoxal phosphate-dependent enzyme [Candidatus Hydrogenedentes bacterium]|nr:aminotransferase class III-fold pyridoxal phosphate-dependent enzyme [Candidatus Hydrogenedentota bacterium]